MKHTAWRLIAVLYALGASAQTLDNFDRANGAVGANWTEVAGSWAISSNRMVLSNPVYGNYPPSSHVVWAPTTWTDVSVQARVWRGSLGSTVGLIARYTRNGCGVSCPTFYLAQLRRTAAGDEYRLYRHAWGYYTQLGGTVVEPYVDGSTLRLTITGTTLTFDMSAGAGFATKVTAQDNSFSSGSVGIRTADTAASFDDFYAASTPGGGGGGGSIAISDVTGLTTELANRPVKASSYAAGRTLRSNGAGEIDVVTGAGSNCVLADGTSTPCASGGGTGAIVCATSGFSTTTYACSASPTLTAYTANMVVHFKPNLTSSNAITLNIDGLGARSVLLADGNSAPVGQFVIGRTYPIWYDSSDSTFKMFAPGAPIAQGEVTGLVSDLGTKATKAAGYAANRAVITDSSGNLTAATGTLTDCVLVNGSSGPCGGGGGSYPTIELNGSTIGARGVLNFTPAVGVLQTITDSGTKIVIATAPDTAVVQTHAADQAGQSRYCASGSANASTYTCALNPALTTYTTGMAINWKPDVNNVPGPITLNVNAQGAKQILLADGSQPAATQFKFGQFYRLVYDGTAFRVSSPGAPVAQTDVTNLVSDLGTKATKAAGYLANRAVITDSSGNLTAATGTLTDCVLVNGSSGPCGGGGGGTTPTWEVEGVTAGSRALLNLTPGSGIVQSITDTGTKLNITTSVNTAVLQSHVADQAGAARYCASASASATTYTCGTSPALSAYTTGMVLHWRPDVSNSAGAVTINVDVLGAKGVKMSDGSTNPGAAEFVGGRLYALWYDGANFRVVTAAGGGSVDLTPYQTLAGAQAGTALLCSTSGTSTAYTCALTPTLGSYTSGMLVHFRPHTTSAAGPLTLNIDSRGAVNIRLADGTTTPGAGEFVAGRMYLLWYDGTLFRVASSSGAADLTPYLTKAAHQAGGTLLCESGSGSASTHTCTMTPTLTAYTANMVVHWKPGIFPTATPTLNIDGLGAIGIRNWNSTAFSDGDVSPGQVYPLWYDGSQFRLVQTAPSQHRVTTGQDNFAILGGSAPTYTACPTSFSILLEGMRLWVNVNASATGAAATLNLCTSGAFPLTKHDGTAPAAADFTAGRIYMIVWDSSGWRLAPTGSSGGGSSFDVFNAVAEDWDNLCGLESAIAPGGSNYGWGKWNWVKYSSGTTPTAAPISSTTWPCGVRLTTVATTDHWGVLGTQWSTQSGNPRFTLTASGWEVQFVVRTPSDLALMSITAGFGPGGVNPSGCFSGITEGVDCVAMIYDAAIGTTWYLRRCSGGACSNVDTGVTVATDTAYRLRLLSTSAGTVQGGVNSSATVSISTSIPAGSFGLLTGVRTRAAVTRSVDLLRAAFKAGTLSLP